MPLTCETMDEYATAWDDECGAPDAPSAPARPAAAVLIADGEWAVDPLEMF